ncbi:MAG: C39 family peptidase, partial [Candidatus Thorarchaeota archaeon]
TASWLEGRLKHQKGLKFRVGVISGSADISTQELNFSLSQEITDVPYVWQEVNGFCFPSALSMVLQSMGLDLGLYDILAASGSGFSMVSISVDETMTFFPGVMVRQIPWFEFFTDLYGLEMQFYLDSSTEYGWYAMQIVASLGCEVTDYADSVLITPLNIMRESIDNGYPLAIGVDTYYLPVEDWDIIRDYVGPMQPGGVGHAIVIVGYNETSQMVQVYDPGVGLLVNNYGYPDDGRWNYSMTYGQLNNAWESAGYVTFRVSNGTGPADDFEERLASYITQRLLGNRTAYFEGAENFFYVGTGANAFRGMGLDMNVETIRNYCTYYLEVDKPAAIRLLGHNLEVMMTMQYLAFRSSLDSLPNLLPSKNLQSFLDSASQALPHMEVLSHNSSITSGINVIVRDTLLYNTFFGMASSFEEAHDLDNAISGFSNELEEISIHLIAIADAWELAGEALSKELEESEGMLDDNLIVVVSGGASILIIAAILIIWRRKSPLVE